MPCLTVAYTRKAFSPPLGLHYYSYVVSFTHTLTTDVCHHVVHRDGNVMQTSVPLSDVQVLRAAAETCASAVGPHSLPAPAF